MNAGKDWGERAMQQVQMYPELGCYRKTHPSFLSRARLLCLSVSI